MDTLTSDQTVQVACRWGPGPGAWRGPSRDDRHRHRRLGPARRVGAAAVVRAGAIGTDRARRTAVGRRVLADDQHPDRAELHDRAVLTREALALRRRCSHQLTRAPIPNASSNAVVERIRAPNMRLIVGSTLSVTPGDQRDAAVVNGRRPSAPSSAMDAGAGEPQVCPSRLPSTGPQQWR